MTSESDKGVNADDRPAVGPEAMLCLAVYQAGHAFSRLYRQVLSELGLTYPQYLIMLMLWERDGLPMKEMGERLILDSGTLTPLLKRLEQAGLIERRRSRVDERRVGLFLTPQGEALRARAACVPTALAAGLRDVPAGRLAAELVALRDTLLKATGEG